MAARENQGLFIAVILLVLLSVVLAVTTFFTYSGQKEASDRADGLKEQLEKAERDASAYQGQAGMMKSWLGVQGSTLAEVETNSELVGQTNNTELIAETERIREAYEQDMNSVTPEGDVDRTYRQSVAAMLTAIADMNEQTVVLNSKVDEIKLKMATEIAAKDAELQQKQTSLDEAIDLRKKAEAAREELREQYTALLNDREQALAIARQQLSKKTSALDSTIKDFKAQLVTREATIQQKKNEIAELTKTETDLADGQIVKVAPRLGKVTINLGTNDGLRLRQNFAVYDNAVSNFKTGKGKASIEVTKILGGGLAEGRITMSDINDPILKHDWIVTPTWDPGQVKNIVIAGRVDLDGNGRSDLQRLISMIEQNGGKVVAYQQEGDGKVFGEREINENVSFYVKGEPPITRDRDGYNRMNSARERFQITEVSVENLMERMGIKPERKIERFDDNLESGGFRERKPTTVDGGSPFDR